MVQSECGGTERQACECNVVVSAADITRSPSPRSGSASPCSVHIHASIRTARSPFRAGPVEGGLHPVGDTKPLHVVPSRRNASETGQQDSTLQWGDVAASHQTASLPRQGDRVSSGAGRLQPNSHHTTKTVPAVQHPAALNGYPSHPSEYKHNSCAPSAGEPSADVQQAPSAAVLASQVWQHRRVHSSNKVSASVLRIARRIMREASSSDDDDAQPDDSQVSAIRHVPCTEHSPVQPHAELPGSERKKACRSPVDLTITQSPTRGSPRQQSPTQHRRHSPHKCRNSPHSKARADRVQRVSSTLDGLKDRAKKLAHRDVALTQDLKGVLDACISSSASGSGPRAPGSSVTQDPDAFSSVHGAPSPCSEWDCCTQQSGSQSHEAAPSDMSRHKTSMKGREPYGGMEESSDHHDQQFSSPRIAAMHAAQQHGQCLPAMPENIPSPHCEADTFSRAVTEAQTQTCAESDGMHPHAVSSEGISGAHLDAVASSRAARANEAAGTRAMASPLTHGSTQVEQPRMHATTQVEQPNVQASAHATTQAAAPTTNSFTQVLSPLSHATTQVEPPESNAVTQTSFSGTRDFNFEPSVPPADAATQAGSPSPTVHAFSQVKHPDSNAVTQTSLSGDLDLRAKSDVLGSDATTQCVPETTESFAQVQSPAAHATTQVDCPDSNAVTQTSISGDIGQAPAPSAHAETHMEPEDAGCLLQGYLGGMRNFSADSVDAGVDAETQVQSYSEHAVSQTEFQAERVATQAECSPEVAVIETQTPARDWQRLSLSKESLAFLLHSQSPVERVCTATQVSSSDGFANNHRGLDILPVDTASQTNYAQQCAASTATQVETPAAHAAATEVETPATNAASQAQAPAECAMTQTSSGGESSVQPPAVPLHLVASRSLPGPACPQWQPSDTWSPLKVATAEGATRAMPTSMHPSSDREGADSVQRLCNCSDASSAPYSGSEADRGPFSAPELAPDVLTSAASTEARVAPVHEMDACTEASIPTCSSRSAPDSTPADAQRSYTSVASGSLDGELSLRPQFVKQLSAEQACEPDAVQPGDEAGSQTFLDINPSFTSVQPDELKGQPEFVLSAQPSDEGSAAASCASVLLQKRDTRGRSVAFMQSRIDRPLSYQQTLLGVTRVEVEDPKASQHKDTNAAPDVLPHQRTTPFSSCAGQTLLGLTSELAAAVTSSEGSDSDTIRSRPAPFVLQRRSPTASSLLNRQTDAVVQLPSASKPVFVSPRSSRRADEADEDVAATGEQSPMQRVLSNQSTPRSVQQGGAADAAAWVEFGRATQSAELVRQAKGMPRSPRLQVPASPRSLGAQPARTVDQSPRASPRYLGPQPSRIGDQSPRAMLCTPQHTESVVTCRRGSVGSQMQEQRETDDDIVQEGKFGRVLKYIVYSNSLYEMDADPLSSVQ